MSCSSFRGKLSSAGTPYVHSTLAGGCCMGNSSRLQHNKQGYPAGRQFKAAKLVSASVSHPALTPQSKRQAWVTRCCPDRCLVLELLHSAQCLSGAALQNARQLPPYST